MNAVRGGAHDPIPVISRIAAEARMSELLGVADSFGFECLGDIGPAPPEARLSYYVEYGHDPREPERRFFIASSASLPKLPKPAPRRQHPNHEANYGGNDYVPEDRPKKLEPVFEH